MKTILFIDKNDEEVYGSFLRYDFLLDEHRKMGAYEVCGWQPEGMSVATALPELEQLVREEDDWRAVVVCNLSKQVDESADDRHFDNPYDFPESYGRSANHPVEESDRAIVRVAQMLGGFPEKTAMVWPEVRKVIDEDVIGSDLVGVENALNGEDVKARTVMGGYDVEYCLSEDRYDLMERYRLGVTRPREIILLTPRDVDADFWAARKLDIEGQETAKREERERLYELSCALDTKRELDAERTRRLAGGGDVSELEAAEAKIDELIAAAGVSEDEIEALLANGGLRDMGVDLEPEISFWERNGYPSGVRFMVFDRLAPSVGEKTLDEDPASWRMGFRGVEANPEALNRRDPWFRFWLCVLSLITAQVEPQYLRAFRLLRTNVVISEDELTDEFSHRYSEWAAVRACIASELAGESARLATSEFEMYDMPDCKTTIPVAFDLVNDHEMMSDSTEVGLIKDRPENDLTVWQRQRRRILDAFRVLLRAPKRAMYNAAAHFQASHSLPAEELEYCRLNAYQCDELSDGLEAAEVELARTTGPKAFSFETYKGSFIEGSKQVVHAINLRPTGLHIAVCLGAAILALVIGFIPYCFGLTGGIGANLAAWLVTIFSCLVLGIVVLVTVVRMRGEVRDAYYGFNQMVSGVIARLRGEAQRMSDRMSGYATFSKQWAVLDRQRRRGEPTARSNELGRMDALLAARMNDIERIAPDVEVEPGVFGRITRAGWESAQQKLDDDAFFSICDVADVERPLNEGTPVQSTARVPYAFIEGLRIETLDLA